MEVSLSNLPLELNDRGLERQLLPHLSKLGIKTWMCTKVRKKQFGQLVFRHWSEGERFLAMHGVQPRPGHLPGTSGGVSLNTKLSSEIPRLKLMNKAVFCRRKDGVVDEWLLKTLILQEEKKETPDNRREATNGSITFRFTELSCGHFDIHDNSLAFIPAAKWGDVGTAKIIHRHLTIEMPNLIKLLIPLHTILEVVACGRTYSLTMTLSDNPVMSRKAGLSSLMVALGLQGRQQTNIPQWERVVSIDEDHRKAAQTSLVFRIQILAEDYAQNFGKLLRRDILTITKLDRLQVVYFDAEHKQAYDNFRTDLLSFDKDNSLSFGVRFQLHKLVDNCYISARRARVLAHSLRDLQKKMPGKWSILPTAIRKWMSNTPYLSPHVDFSIFDIANMLTKLLEIDTTMRMENYQNIGKINGSENQALVHQLIVTPTRVTLEGPEWENNNRILRKYPDHHDYFMRVRFVDENGESVFFDRRMTQDSVYAKYKHVLEHGIMIGGRLFSFLGFSHSSLRSQSVWFQAPFQYKGSEHSYRDIISGIGSFSHFRSPAKCAARIGQAFSETPIAIPLAQHKIEVKRISDVTCGERVFSDGVGTISPEVVDIINGVYVSNDRAAATCFQIRLGGAKGMLSMDTRLQGRQVRLRQSMVKFVAETADHLELCDAATRPIPMVLNRQLIKILEDLNVPDKWFLRLQERELNSLRYVLRSGASIAKFLRGQNTGVSIGLPQFYQFVHQCSWEFRQDYFLRSVVETVVLERLRLLKYKARIPVDEGVTLLGVMDETGFLKEGEVYVAFDHPDGMISGHMPDQKVLVTRSPALHAGDVQVVRHVNPPLDSPLSALANCVVFSQHGTRDLPSMLSGGDLDGDLYNIIWAREAIQPTHAPADYPKVQEKLLDRPVKRSDMADFFIEFMKSDILGVISTRHMMIADQKKNGTLDPDCVKLAELCSQAVDYSKSGNPVSLASLPRSSRYRPDFLAAAPPVRILKRSQIDFDAQEAPTSYDSDDEYIGSSPKHQYYESEKLLGKLYRAIDEKQVWKEDIHKEVPLGSENFWAPLLRLFTTQCRRFNISWDAKIDDARQIKSVYEDAITDMMYNYSEHPTQPLTELEVFIGTVHNKTGAQTRRQRDNSIKLKEEINQAITYIAKHIRKAASDHYDGPEQATTVDDASSVFSDGTETVAGRYASVELALSCLHVACADIDENPNSQHRSRTEQLVSFRVVAASVLRREMEWAMPGWTKPQAIYNLQSAITAARNNPYGPFWHDGAVHGYGTHG